MRYKGAASDIRDSSCCTLCFTILGNVTLLFVSKSTVYSYYFNSFVLGQPVSEMLTASIKLKIVNQSVHGDHPVVH